MQWYYAENGRQAGPVSELELDRLHGEGKVSDSTLVWRSGMGDWQPYGVAIPSARDPGGAPAVGAASAAAGGGVELVECSQCRSRFPLGDVLRYGADYVCAACKPTYFQRIREGADTGERVYAGFWIRLGASMIDGLVLFGAIIVLVIGLVLVFGAVLDGRRGRVSGAEMLLFQLIAFFVYIVIPWLYDAVFTSRYGGTPGKLLLRLCVIRDDGAKISFGRATGRFFAKMLSYMILYIGCIIAAFDSEKRALHDHLAGTRVILR